MKVRPSRSMVEVFALARMRCPAPLRRSVAPSTRQAEHFHPALSLRHPSSSASRMTRQPTQMTTGGNGLSLLLDKRDLRLACSPPGVLRLPGCLLFWREGAWSSGGRLSRAALRISPAICVDPCHVRESLYGDFQQAGQCVARCLQAGSARPPGATPFHVNPEGEQHGTAFSRAARRSHRSVGQR